MALQKQFNEEGAATIQTSFGAVQSGTSTFSFTPYIKVTSLRGDKTLIEFSCSFSDGDTVLFKDYTFAPDLYGPNFIKQAYEHLKTLPEFAGAADV